MPRFRLRLQEREIALPDSGQLVVGRDATAADLALEDRLVSRRHAAFRCAGGETIDIVDLDSLNGVRVNDAPVKGSRTLAHRDRVQIGAHVFLVIDDRRERRSGAATTRATARAVSPTRRSLRPVSRSRDIVTPLDTIEHALSAGDLAGARSAMDAIVGRYADPGEPLAPGELGRVVELLLALAEQTGEARFFDRIFQAHTGRSLILDGPSIDAIQSALPRLTLHSLRAIETYLEAMHARAATLTSQEQVRLRRISTLARRAAKGGAT